MSLYTYTQRFLVEIRSMAPVNSEVGWPFDCPGAWLVCKSSQALKNAKTRCQPSQCSKGTRSGGNNTVFDKDYRSRDHTDQNQRSQVETSTIHTRVMPGMKREEAE